MAGIDVINALLQTVTFGLVPDWFKQKFKNSITLFQICICSSVQGNGLNELT